MLARELMATTVATVRPHDHLRHAAALMQEFDCGCVVVIDDQRRPLAVLTDRDVALAALRTDRPLSCVEVSEVMAAAAHVCRADADLQAAQDAMAEHQVRRLPVVDEGGLLVGLLALDDLARHAVAAPQAAGPGPAAAVGALLGRLCRRRAGA